MAVPSRTFSANDGDYSTPPAGPNQLEADIDAILAKLNGNLDSTNLAAGAATDTVIGNRTIDDAIATPSAKTGVLTNLLSWLGKAICALSGMPNFYDAPPDTLSGLDSRMTTAEGDITTNAGNIASVSASLGLDIADLAAHKAGNDHDGRYYTEAETAVLLSGKSNTGHTHDDRYYTEAELGATNPPGAGKVGFLKTGCNIIPDGIVTAQDAIYILDSYLSNNSIAARGSGLIGLERSGFVIVSAATNVRAALLELDGALNTHKTSSDHDSRYTRTINLITSADVTYYVSPTGNDSNDGLTALTAFLTITKAISMIPYIVNHAITIIVADGAYAEHVYVKGRIGYGSISIIGNLTTPDNVTVYTLNSSMLVIPIAYQGIKVINHIFNVITAEHCKLIEFNKVKIGSVIAANAYSFYNCDYVTLTEPTISGSYIKGIYSNRSRISILNGNLGTGSNTMFYLLNSDLYSYVNSGGDPGNTLVTAIVGSRLIKSGAQPSGTENVDASSTSISL